MQPTGKESASLANLFGLPYVITSKQRSFDVKTLNYNWQINGTDAFSVYSGDTGHINEFSAKQAVSAVLRFLTRMGILKYNCHNGYIASIIEEEDMRKSRRRHRDFSGVLSMSERKCTGDSS